MPMYVDLNQKKMFDNTLIKLVFEFHSPIRRSKLANKLSKYLRKKIMYGKHIEPKSVQTDRVFTLSPGFNEGHSLNNMITGYLPYNEALFVTYRMMDLINEYGFTTDKTRLKMSFKSTNPSKIGNIGAYKFLLNLGENDILKEWNEPRGERLYYNNLIYIYPKDVFSLTLNENSINHMNSQMYVFPNSMFLGTDMSERLQGVISASYIGGKNYQRKKAEAGELINSLVVNFQNAANEGKFNGGEISKLSMLIESQRNFIYSMKTYEGFTHNYPDINLYVDLSGHKDAVKTKYHMIRQKLFELLAYAHVLKGDVNYDSSRDRIQAMNVNITNGINIHDMDFLESKLVADLSNCQLNGCKVSSSSLTDCNMYDTNIKYSRMRECHMAESVEVDRSYVYNEKILVNGVMRNSLIYGPLSSSVEMDSHTKVYF